MPAYPRTAPPEREIQKAIAFVDQSLPTLRPYIEELRALFLPGRVLTREEQLRRDEITVLLLPTLREAGNVFKAYFALVPGHLPGYGGMNPFNMARCLVRLRITTEAFFPQMPWRKRCEECNHVYIADVMFRNPSGAASNWTIVTSRLR